MNKDDFQQQEQRGKRGWRLLLPLIALVLLVGIGTWQVLIRQTTSVPDVSNNPHFSSSGQTTRVSKSTPPAVANDVRRQVAQKLHLSVDQLTTKLQTGVSIESLAAQQGMSPDGWRTFVLTTYQAAFNQEVSAGKVTQAQADHDMHNIRSYPLDALNGWVTNDCLGITDQ